MNTAAAHQTAPRVLLGAALAALQWARLAAWLLELHEAAPAPRIALERTEQALDLAGSLDHVYGQLATLDDLRARWVAEGDRLTARMEALDACRRAIIGAAYAWEGQRLERDSSMRETITLTLHAWRLYAGVRSEDAAHMVSSHAALLSPLVVLASNLSEPDATAAIDTLDALDPRKRR